MQIVWGNTLKICMLYPENLHVAVFLVINSVLFCPNSVLLTFHAFGYKNSHNAKTKQF